MAQTLEYNGSISQVSAVTVPVFDEDMDIIQKLDDEPNDVGGLTAEQLKAEFDAAGKKTKEYINNELIPAIIANALTEETRANAEAERVANEQERVSNEETRLSAESGRTSAEANRVIAENNRVSAEQSRVTAEAARVSAEQARVDSTNGIVAQATAQANAAKTSADGAKASATAAASSATSASNSASNAASSASSAASSSSSASSSASAARAAQAAAEKARDEAQGAVGGDFATKTEVSDRIKAHNESTSAHGDIRQLIQQSAGYTKAQTLADVTKTKFGLGADAVPDDVFGVLSRFQNGLGNEYVWAKTGVIPVPQKGSSDTTTYLIATSSPVETNVVQYSDGVEVVDGVVRLKNPATLDLSYNNYTAANILIGKYFIPSQAATENYGESYSVHFCESGSVERGTISGFYYVHITNGVQYKMAVTETVSVVGYVNSPDPNAYPVDDGYTYTALGQLGAKVQIATGSYTGTGTYGANNPNRLTFDFAPKVVLLLGVTDSDGTSWSSRLGKTDYGSNTIMVLDAMTTEYKQRDGFINSNKSDYKNYGRKSADGKTVEWYSTISADTQCNSSGVNFHHLAIG